MSNKVTEVIWSHLRSFGVIWDHMESFKSWGNKISYTINMQRLLSFFVGSQRQCWPTIHVLMPAPIWISWCIKLVCLPSVATKPLSKLSCPRAVVRNKFHCNRYAIMSAFFRGIKIETVYQNLQRQKSILQPFQAGFLPTTFISFSKLRFRPSFCGAEQV